MIRIFDRPNRLLRAVAIAGAVSAITACHSGSESVGVHLTPSSADLAPLTTQKFAVAVDGTLDANVTWSLVDADGNPLTAAKFGAIAPAGDGTYTAPAAVPKQSDNDFFVKATSTVDPTKWATARIHVVAAPISPARGPTVGGTRVTITGDGFSAATKVFFGANEGTNLTVESATTLRVTSPASTLANLIGVTDVTVDNGGESQVVYPQAWHYGATLLRLGGGQLVPSCYGSYIVQVGDINGDGLADAVSTCYDYQLPVMLNDGHGALRSPTFVPTSYYGPDDMKLADMDGDGSLDIVVAYQNGILILTNDGTGAFTPQPLIAYEGLAPTAIEYDVALALDDFDGDGATDLAYSMPAQKQVVVRRNDGAGAFGTAQLIATNTDPFNLVAATVHAGAAVPDLVASYGRTVPGSNETGGFQLLTNDGSGNFAVTGTFAAKVFNASMAVGDFNGDGKLDVATGSESGDGSDIGVRLGDGNGGFGGETFFVDHTAHGYVAYRGLTAFDVDGDGRSDLVNMDDQHFEIFYGQSAGPVLDNATSYSSTDWAYGVQFADLGDGLQMIASDFEQLELYERQGTRGFGAPTLGVGNSPGSLDLLWQNSQPNVVAALLKGNTGGNGGAVSLVGSASLTDTSLMNQTQKFDLPANSAALRVLSVDVDGDTLQDAVVVDDGSNAPFAANAPLQGAVYILPGQADGSLGNTANKGMGTFTFTDAASDARVADLDGDGVNDLIVATNNESFGATTGTFVAPTSGSLQVLWGNPDGSFSAPQTVSAGVVPFAITLADLDDDGLPEIITADQVGNRVAIVKFDAEVAREPIYVDVGQAPSEVRITDVNGDYIPDLVVLATYNSQGTTMVEVDVAIGLGTVELGNGTTDIVFDVPDRYRFNGEAHGITIGDLDGDGLGDLALSLSFPPSVAVLRGDDGGKFLDPEFVPVGGSPWAVTIMDFDGSGTLDLVVGDTMSNALRPLSNKSL